MPHTCRAYRRLRAAESNSTKKNSQSKYFRSDRRPLPYRNRVGKCISHSVGSCRRKTQPIGFPKISRGEILRTGRMGKSKHYALLNSVFKRICGRQQTFLEWKQNIFCECLLSVFGFCRRKRAKASEQTYGFFVAHEVDGFLAIADDDPRPHRFYVDDLHWKLLKIGILEKIFLCSFPI